MISANRDRTRFEGVMEIFRFNWTFYAVAAAVILTAALLISRLPIGSGAAWAMNCGIALATFWLLASIIVSHWIYDRSPLMRWDWIAGALNFEPRAWINIHSGLDESTPALRKLFADSAWRVLDIYDQREMSEPSIRRARALARNAIRAETASFGQLPVEHAAADAVFLLLAAHGLRHQSARDAFFAELERILAPGGQIVLAEHLRDVPNAIAFGPGVLHFHSRRIWLKTIRRGGFSIEKEFRITPFVRVFVFGRSS